MSVLGRQTQDTVFSDISMDASVCGGEVKGLDVGVCPHPSPPCPRAWDRQGHPNATTGNPLFMFMFRSKRTTLAKRLWKSRVRQEHETQGTTEGQESACYPHGLETGGGVCCGGGGGASPAETALKTLLKRLKENQLEMLLAAVESRGADLSACVLLPRDLPPEPHVLCCQIWRWPDVRQHCELKRLPVCRADKDPVYLCCNPYHWSRLCRPVTVAGGREYVCQPGLTDGLCWRPLLDGRGNRLEAEPVLLAATAGTTYVAPVHSETDGLALLDSGLLLSRIGGHGDRDVSIAIPTEFLIESPPPPYCRFVRERLKPEATTLWRNELYTSTMATPSNLEAPISSTENVLNSIPPQWRLLVTLRLLYAAVENVLNSIPPQWRLLVTSRLLYAAERKC
uniref:MH1 domain-containing protein n=1 Tax=Timema genevievae TaxID=629358 RepID=A0A7R9PNI5_TIMGE|nr:unnamed protein product [Timema genevievae]